MARRYYEAEDVSALVEGAVSKISQYATATLYVTAKRAQTKADRLEPTDNQARLLRFITTHGFMSFEETLGMDWRYLGGLFTRGLVEWGRDRHGAPGVVPAVVGKKEG